jgi:hypothetical protein
MRVSLFTIFPSSSIIFFRISNSLLVRDISLLSKYAIFLETSILILLNVSIQSSFCSFLDLLRIVFILAKSSLGEKGFAI